jgi:hypothetical protein
MIDEGDIPSIQCKMSFRGPNSLRKEDDLSLIFIDFCSSAYTTSQRNETSLQLSEVINLFAICNIYADVISKKKPR